MSHLWQIDTFSEIAQNLQRRSIWENRPKRGNGHIIWLILDQTQFATTSCLIITVEIWCLHWKIKLRESFQKLIMVWDLSLRRFLTLQAHLHHINNMILSCSALRVFLRQHSNAQFNSKAHFRDKWSSRMTWKRRRACRCLSLGVLGSSTMTTVCIWENIWGRIEVGQGVLTNQIIQNFSKFLKLLNNMVFGAILYSNSKFISILQFAFFIWNHKYFIFGFVHSRKVP